MKRTTISFLTLMLSSVMLVGAFASCKNGGEETTTSKGDTAVESTTAGAEDTTAEDTTTEKETEIVLEGEFGNTITHSNKLSNEVQSYYNSDRSFYTVENLNMTLKYPMEIGSSNKVTSLSNKKGGVYLKDTMDVFVETTDGEIYYASNSSTPARPNVYRFGYYYYDVHLLEQNFISDYETLASEDINIKIFANKGSSSVSSADLRKGDSGYYLSVKVKDSIDP